MGASLSPQLGPGSLPHVHLADEVCPYCEQPIPNDRAQEIQERFKAKEREQAEALKRKMNEQLARERQQIEANAKAAVVAANEALQATTAEKLAEAERQKNEAVSQAESLKANMENTVNQRAQEIRQAMEKDKTLTVNAIKAQHFQETLKLNEMVQNLQRRLDQKNAEELGEGAEIDLFEALKGEYPDDHITRVPKGTAGADIIHVVKHNGKECGRIVYDSKNRKGWRDDYVTKLREDQIAAEAVHAVLSTLKFPAGAHQLEVREGVIIANPARVVALVQMLRRHIVLVHSLRLSNSARAQKTDELYEFIRSGHCRQLFERIDSQAEDLLELQEKEKRAHDKMWNQQGTLFRGIQRAHGELISEIERIIGTGSDAG
jgi:hypothetical protein